MAKIHLGKIQSSEESYIPRDDYEELQKLCLLYLESLLFAVS